MINLSFTFLKKSLLMTNLIIVESPSKCHKVVKAAGDNFVCLSSKGHIYELEKGLSAIDINNNFTPKYKVKKDKQSIIKLFKSTKKKYDTIFLAMDPDREGEAIALHLAEELKITSSAKRITFNEISKSAIQTALSKPRKIDFHLCDAQKARRVLDRLMGFEISPLLWNHLPDQNSLSAGRCQSPALELVSEREKDIDHFQTNNYFNLHGILLYKGNHLKVSKLDKITDCEIGKTILNDCLTALYYILNIETKKIKNSPPPPFTTSSLQQEISQKLNLPPKMTMLKAQKLYEQGVITYMRTDSTSLSEDAHTSIKKCILDKYGDTYYQSRQYNSKIKNAQEAHECIRCVDFNMDSDDILDDIERKIYQIILSRTLASQMKQHEKKVNKIIIIAKKDNKEYKFICQEETTLFDGYNILYNLKNSKLTEINIGDHLELNYLELDPSETKPKSRYTEAGLIKVLEKSGIGRPSTFSNIITTLFDRNYIEKGSNLSKKIKNTVWYINKEDIEIQKKEITKQSNTTKGKIVLTSVGKSVLEFLNNNFKNLLDSKLTSIIEDDLDKVANGEIRWFTIVSKFYDSFHPQVVKLLSNTINSKNIKWIKQIGVDSNSNEYGIIKGKFGNCFGLVSKENKISYLPIVKLLYGTGKNIKVDQLEYMFMLPQVVGEGDPYYLYYGINGFYLKYREDTVNLDGDYSQGIRLELDEIKKLFASKCGYSIVKKDNYDYKIIETKYGSSFLRKSNKKELSKYLPIVSSIYGDGKDISIDELEFMFKLPIKLYDKYQLYYGRNGYYCKNDNHSAKLEDKNYFNDLPNENYLIKIFEKFNLKSKIINKHGDYVVMHGQYGPFVLYKKKIYLIKSKLDLEKFSKKDCIQLVNK